MSAQSEPATSTPRLTAVPDGSGGPGGSGVAGQLAAALAPFVGGELPVHLTAWDGSSAGPADAPGVRLASPDALRRILWQPGELGAAQAYVTGELSVDGDLDEGLTKVRQTLEQRGVDGVRRSPAALVGAVRTALGVGALSLPPAPPASQARLPRGLRARLHAPARDRWAISHHYDLSNEFYAMLLGETMAYSSGYFSSPDDDLDVAQRAKLDLVLDKLGLEAGMTMLDVGCGWGSLTVRAAERGVRVTGLTIAAEQKAFVDERIARQGLGDLAEVRLLDYREAAGRYDAVASIEMGEHVGQKNYPTYAGVLHDRVRPGGRVLVQQMSRRGRHPGGGPFIESFIAPDMHMRPVGDTVSLLEGSGLEARDVHGLREHYVYTCDRWLERFRDRHDDLVALVGEEVVRVWELYLVGGRQAFRDNRMGVDQILLVRPSRGESELPLVRAW